MRKRLSILVMVAIVGAVLAKTEVEISHIAWRFPVAGPWDIGDLRPVADYTLILEGEEPVLVRTSAGGYIRIVLERAGFVELTLSTGTYCTPSRIE